MPSLKDLKNRIESVKSTRKITKAMQMVAAAKLRRAQEAAEASRPYTARFNAVMAGLAASAGGGDAPKLLAGTGSDQVHLLVVMTAERGLCGGFNSSIAKMARAKAQELQAQGKTVKILTVGKKGREQLKRDLEDLMIDHVDLSEVKRLGYNHAQGIAADLINRFNAGEFDVATMFFSRFESVISQVPTATQIIPASYEASDEDAADSATVYDYEPSEEGILATLLPSGVATQLFSALLENGASEQGARMSAMDNATRNAGDMIDKLTIEFNRSRQAVITNELIEIISGAEAL
ncbi:F0F1 ATP synthase subunit gamma [Aliiroseovarius subalbicans]|uniref:F0F1 ATP synthase subunit gamma n=1 Tax=Aliiroseovarius subalbicans TaxID=2925840 RepID=UPI001F582318|nr:F0F1 ATP synthase subunit gamma [Aliiroseovarius subalbicans]MCI2400615.1 F0F1 ATP synthase subunit gamma [Aliiroseovarius subalbicans]